MSLSLLLSAQQHEVTIFVRAREQELRSLVLHVHFNARKYILKLKTHSTDRLNLIIKIFDFYSVKIYFQVKKIQQKCSCRKFLLLTSTHTYWSWDVQESFLCVTKPQLMISVWCWWHQIVPLHCPCHQKIQFELKTYIVAWIFGHLVSNRTDLKLIKNMF